MAHQPPLALTAALKEWAIVCDQLLAGRQVLLLRKGGIHEGRKGFALEHDAFFLYPNAEHQSATQLKPQLHALLAAAPTPARERGTVAIPGLCRVVDVVPVTDPARLRALEPHTCWTQALFDMRLNYKPERPNYVVTVRAYRFPAPVEVPYHKGYAGCRSWVPLKDDALPSLTAAAAASVPALDDEAFQAQRRAVLATVQ